MNRSSAPLFNHIARGPDNGIAQWRITQDGLRIRVGHWPAQTAAPKGTVLIFPGRTEYIEKYGPTAADMTAQGFATLAIDWRGQGLADRMLPDRKLGHVQHFKDFQHDVQAVLSYATEQALPKPWYLLAHSMGGAIGLRALIQGLPVSACCFSAPMWGIGISPALRIAADILRKVVGVLKLDDMRTPTTSVGQYIQEHTFDDNSLTGDPQMYRFLQDQLAQHPELVLGGPTLRWLSQSIEECAQLASLTSPAQPCTTLLGADEQIVDIPAIHNRMARWHNGTLVTIPSGRHELLLETPEIRETVTETILKFYLDHNE